MKRLILICILFVFFGAKIATAQTWTTIDASQVAGTQGFPNNIGNTYAMGISGNEVVGWFGTGGTNPTFLGNFVYTGGCPTLQNPNPGWSILDVSTQVPGVTATYANGINGSNIVGYYTTSGTSGSSNLGYLYDGTNYTTINAASVNPGAIQTFANGVSGNIIVGTCEDKNGYMYGYTYDISATTLASLNCPLPNAINTNPTGIDGTNVVGSLYIPGSGLGNQGFLCDLTQTGMPAWTLLDYPGAHDTSITGISGNLITGTYDFNNGITHGFFDDLTQSGTSGWTTIDNPTAGTTWTQPTGIDGDNFIGNFGDPKGFLLKITPQWKVAVSGSWSNPTNWTFNAPNTAGVNAVINLATTSAITITLNSPQTIGSLLFGNSASKATGYILTGSGTNTLTLNNSGSASTITVANGSHVIDAPIILDNNLVISGSGTLAFGGDSSITDNGEKYSLSFGGSGTLILSGSASYTGGTFVEDGALIATAADAIPKRVKLDYRRRRRIYF